MAKPSFGWPQPPSCISCISCISCAPHRLRGRTYRTYRTYRTAASPRDFPNPKHGVRSPPCPYRLPGRTCALRARTARPSVAFLCVPSRGRFASLCPLRSFVSFVVNSHWQSAGGSRPLIGFNLWTTEGLSSEAKKHRRFLLRRLLKRRGRTYRTYRTGRLMPPCMHSDLFVAP